MVARGRVRNGVVVLNNGVRLPEGQEVTVLVDLPFETRRHSILDIAPISVGAVLRRFCADDDCSRDMLDEQ